MPEAQPDTPVDYRELDVVPAGDGMRLDVFLARRFADRSRSWIAAGIKRGLVRTPEGRVLRASVIVRAGERLHLFLDGIAPSGPPPAFPRIVFEDARVVALDKPAGLLAHPAGTDYSWSVVGLARDRWRDHAVDIVHRLDRDTSGIQLVTKDMDANRKLKAVLHADGALKEYLAICKGVIPWDTRVIEEPLGPCDGEIRIQQTVRPDGLSARTDVTVLDRKTGPGVGLTLVRCRIYTGRTHQIRVHLCHEGFPILGDRMYGVSPEIFLGIYNGADPAESFAAVGAPRQALHATRMIVPHPSGGPLEVVAGMPDDMQGWWDHPETLPWDGAATVPLMRRATG